MNRPEQGEVWWADLPEPAGRRPVVVLTRSDAIPVLANVTVAPLTRSIRGIPTEVELTEAHGVPTRSAVSLDNILTVPQSDLVSRIVVLDADTMNAVFEAIHRAFGMPF
jgi:mRNA interferase MazF